jgi:U3 small nucleolar RNA-associated protein 20
MFQQLLKVIERTTNVSGRYTQQLIEMFMSHHNNHYLKYRPITFGFLSMFSSVRSLSKFLEIDSEFSSILLKMLTSGELKLQELSLNCLLLLNDESVKTYADFLREIIKEESFLENLSSFDDKNMPPSFVFTEVLSRILYGKMISKVGRNSKNFAKSRRKAIFGFLIKFRMFLEPFVSLMISPFASKSDSKIDRSEMGFLNILEDFIGQLQLFLTPSILTRLCDTLVTIGRHPESVLEKEDDSEKNLRGICLKRWRQLFEVEFEMDFSKYREAILDNLVCHKVKNFASENTQAPSALLLLCEVWTKRSAYTPWLFHHTIKDLLPNIVAILSEKKVKDSVISVVLSIIEELQKQCLESSTADEFVALHYRKLFPQVLLHGRNVLKASLDLNKLLPYQLRLISIISEASLLGANADDCLEILEILFPYLKKPSKFFSEKLKIQLLNIFINFSECIPQNQRALESSMHFRTIAQLYLSMETRLARQSLSKAMNIFESWDGKLVIVSDILGALNSYNEKRIDEPDYKRQMIAFSSLNNELLHKLDYDQWLPIIYHLLFTLKSDDYASRSSAALSIELFIKLAAESDSLVKLVEFIILPTIKNGLKTAQEVVRVEYMRFLGLMVKQFKFWKLSEELYSLLGSDDETNFFSNIYHLQLHRRSRALRSLESVILEGKVSSPTVANIFMPILHHFILESKGKDHNFINEVVRLIGVGSRFLNWGYYSASLNQYLKLLQKPTDVEKIIFRSIMQIVENCHFVFTENIMSSGDEQTTQSLKDASSAPLLSIRKLLMKLEDLFPSNPSDSAIRVQIAYALSVIYKQLPREEGKLKVQKLFSKLSTMLSNHVQDYRDNARDVLAKIIMTWGSLTFPDAIKQLHLQLDRGYKKHILAYTLNWLLVRVVESICPTDLNAVLEIMVNICIDDIFGFTAEEKEVVELKSKFKEIKKSKSQDTLEILARAISFESLVILLIPIKEVMMVTTDIKSINILRETFMRIAIGINSNKSAVVDELFAFIRELLTENLSLSRISSESKKLSQIESNYMVQMKRPTGKEPLKILAANAYLFIDFGLSIFLTFLKKEDGKISLSLLDPFVDIMGSLIYSVHDSVLSQVLKIWCILVNSRLPRLELVAPVILKRVIKIITNSAALDSELSQMALRLLSTLIREGHAESLSQNQIAAILSILKPNLDEPSKQSFVFGIVQSIISTKIICDEVYDIMDEIMRNMIVNQTESIRNVCRLTFIKFILTYPHGQSKLDKLVGFVVKGLEYEYESGRLTILEVINDLVEKFSTAILGEYFEMIFMALTLDIINDESSKCKEVASAVLKRLLQRASNSQLDKMMTVINSWNENSSNDMLQNSSLLIYGIMIESCLAQMEDRKLDIVKRAALVLENADRNSQESSLTMSADEMDWIKLYYAILLFSKAMLHFPDVAIGEISLKNLKELLLHGHQWVRSITGKLFGQVFSYFNLTSESDPVLKDCFNNGQFMTGLGKIFCSQLDSNLSDEEYSLQVVKNLVFVSKKILVLEQESDDQFLSVLIMILSRKSRQEASKSKNTLIVIFYKIYC